MYTVKQKDLDMYYLIPNEDLVLICCTSGAPSIEVTTCGLIQQLEITTGKKVPTSVATETMQVINAASRTGDYYEIPICSSAWS